MICKEIRSMLPDYGRKILNDRSAGLVEEHVTACTSCRLELDGWRKLFVRLDARTETKPNPVYWQNLLPRINERIARSHRRLVPEWMERYALPSAMAAIVGLLILIDHFPQDVSNLQNDKIGLVSEGGLDSILVGMKYEEVRAALDQMSGFDFTNGQISDQLTSDRTVFREIIGESARLYSAIEVNVRDVIQSLNDQEITHIIAQLDEKRIVN